MPVIKWRLLAINALKKSVTLSDGSDHSIRKKVKIDDQIRLVPFDKMRKQSLKWYQDSANMRNVVGIPTRYTKEQVQQMYEWQNEHGLLYYIEYQTGVNRFQTIGDVWLAEDDYAIVLDEKFRNRHIGRKVTKYFIYKAKKMGRDFITVSEIFNWNKASQKMFTKLKFYPFEEQKDSWSYRRKLKK